ncbi:hypothetical protein TSUD_386090 [Trifolium subterraneum]|uniref:Reverse transcriptase domain-containing protein n=1 Tax=Trifolium subterraneum TaxID=3900 RepID=A0A2Z6MJP4_TRISU|nr:hypothetical protein TSUD_386090 [Trifolium subterraneum]
MRDREGLSGGALRAYLGQLHRSFPSAERQTRGGRDQARVPDMGWDDGEWTEVKQRRRKERRQAERGFEDERQQRHNRGRSTSTPRRQFFNKKHNRNQVSAYDHNHSERYRCDRSCTRSHSGLDRRHRWLEEHHHGERMAGFRQREDNRQQQHGRQLSYSPSRTHGRLQSPCYNFENRQHSSNTWNIRVRNDTDCVYPGAGKENNEGGGEFGLGTNLKRYVSFYFTNFPAQLSLFYLRKGFEVCGMLKDVYVAKKRNIYGEPYGFVKFSNVRNVDKLLKALNVVYFGHFRVRARVARFDRNDMLERRSSGMVKAVSKKGHKSPESVVKNVTNSGKDGVDVAKGSSSSPEDVRVGDIVVRIGKRQEPTTRNKTQEQEYGLILKKPTIFTDVDKEKDGRIYLRNFRTTPDDVKWIQNGLVATIINGEAVPVVQNRITDAGFNDLILVPMGADKVFVRSSAGVDVWAIVDGAKEFFTLIFSNWVRWGNEGFSYQRGAWVRLYGIPIHAWNVHFFKLCVFYCGRSLRADNFSVHRDRLDFARVLIATPDLEIIKRVETVLVDGTLTEIMIVEEWGYALGEDTCLFEDESEAEASQTDNEVEHDDPEGRRDVDMLVKKLADGLGKEDDLQLREKPDEHIIEEQVANLSSKEGMGDEDVQTTHVTDFSNDSSGVCGDKDVRTVRREGSIPIYPRSKRTKSCPPIENRPVLSGPWSLEWLHDLNQGDAGVIFSASKRRKKGGLSGATLQNEGQQDLKRKKAVCVMKIISWIVRGLGGLEKRNEVRKLVVDQNPFFICLQESKMQTCDVFLCSALWGNSPHDFSYRPSVGASGGLLSIWDSNEVEVWSTESREHVLWCHGRFIKSGEEFSVANVYAPCDDGAKQGLWDSLSASIQTLRGQQVCICGDFNAIKRLDERRSSRGVHRFGDHIPFNRFIEDNDLIYLPLSGRNFTWFKGDGLSMSRLDRFMLFEEWCLTWPNCKQEARMRGLSDHCPLILFANEEDWGPCPSRMLKCWKDIPGYHVFVREKWKTLQVDGWGGYVLKEKLKIIKAALKEWHSAHTQNLPSRIDSLKIHLSTLDQKGEEETLTEAELVELHGVTADIHSLSKLHASICWQQSRSLWLKEGDANSKYFHSIMARRRRGNVISSILVDEVNLEGVSPIRQAVVSHFASHFKATHMNRPGVDNLLFKTLNPLECGSLIKPFSVEEVKSAVWDCDNYKSPGPDGINFGFIKDFWADLQGDVMRFISEFHRNGKLTKGLNSTFIALIPKVDSPQRLNDFRPISLVGSLYKILAKVLANRLRLVIGSMISESQTAFVKDRQILDGILIANEVVDEARRAKKELLLFKVDFEKAYDSVDWGYLDAVMGRILYKILAKVLANRLRLVIGSMISESQTAFVKDRQILDGILIANEVVDEARRAKKELLLFKVDFEKAYDSVDWGYLDAVMGRMSFPTLWRKWIRECVCTATTSVLVNGSPTDEFSLERGLRQGDPLSPFLFLLAAEGLSVLMKTMVEHHLFTGYSVGEREPISVSHLQFANDTLLLGVKSWANVRALRAVLVLFESMSDLKVNFNKSMLVGVNTPDSWLSEAASALRCNVGTIPFINLGLSVGGNQRRLSFWDPVLACLKNRLSGWTSRFMSFGGRLVMLKSVLTSLPVYALSFFKAPSGKWCWRMLVDRGGLWFRVLAARYGLERGRLCAGGMSGSQWWREIVRIRDGGGEIGGGWRLFDLAENKSFTVAEMFSLGWGAVGEAWVWRQPLRASEEEMLGECQTLLLTVSLQDHFSDRWQWQPDLDSGYTARGAYQLLTDQDVASLDVAASLIWHSQVPLKVSIFAWRLLRDRLPTKANLTTRGCLSSGLLHCVSGCGEVETAQHLFLSCSIFGSLWPLVSFWIGSSLVTAQTLPDHFVQFTNSAGGSRARRSFMQLIWLACVWVVWTERNHRLFRGSANSLLHMLDKIKNII